MFYAIKLQNDRGTGYLQKMTNTNAASTPIFCTTSKSAYKYPDKKSAEFDQKLLRRKYPNQGLFTLTIVGEPVNRNPIDFDAFMDDLIESEFGSSGLEKIKAKIRDKEVADKKRNQRKDRILTKAGKKVKINPSKRAKAAKLYEDFTGHAVKKIETFKAADFNDGIKVGKITGILYSTTRDGAREKYIHEFGPKAQAHLAVSADGRAFCSVGGKFRFTDAGFVDNV